VGDPQEVIRTYLSAAKTARPETLNKEAYVTKLEVRGRLGPQLRFETGDDAWLDIDVRANVPCERLSLSLYLEDERGIDVFNTSTERLGCPTYSLAAGETARFTVRLKLCLAPGAFNIGTHIYRYDIEKMLDDQMPLGTLFVTSARDVRGVANLFPEVESFAAPISGPLEPVVQESGVL
jgi:hypothetical protein